MPLNQPIAIKIVYDQYRPKPEKFIINCRFNKNGYMQQYIKCKMQNKINELKSTPREFIFVKNKVCYVFRLKIYAEKNNKIKTNQYKLQEYSPHVIVYKNT